MVGAIVNTLNGLRMSAKSTIMIIVALIALSAATAAGMHTVLYDSAAAQGAERQEANMRVAWSVLATAGRGFRLDGDRLYVGATLLDGNDAAVDRIKALVGGTATIFRGDMRVSTNVKKDDGARAIGTRLKRGPAYDAVLGRGERYRGMTDILGQSYFAAYDPIRDGSGRVIGVLFVGIPAADFFAQVNSVERRQLTIAIVVTLIAAMACMIAARAMFRPLTGMEQVMTALAQGRHDIPVPGTGRGDEIGQMARAVAIFRENAIAKQAADQAKARADAEQRTVVDTVSAHLSDLSGGDLTTAIRADFPVEYAVLKSNFNDALARLRDLIGSVTDSAATIRTGSGEIAQASEDLARRTESNAASLEQTAASVTQMDARLRTSAGAAARTVERADQAIATVDGGRAVADEAVQAMGRVSDSARGIDGVIEGLDKIAFQTRVLAMNAAVEAGRAGEAGRGFAVVADLVSALAMRAEEEARRARDQLTATQTDIVTAVDAVTRVDGALAAISGDVGQVHELLATMAADNQAQSAAITQISAAIGTMDQSTQQNAAMVEQTSAAARNLVGEVVNLAEQAGRFRVGQNVGPGRAASPVKPNTIRPAVYRSPVRALPMAALPIASNAIAGHAGEDWTSF